MFKKKRAPVEATTLLIAVILFLLPFVRRIGRELDAAVEPGGWQRYIIDLNSADERLLRLLPGIGPVVSRTMIEWRMQNGPFCSSDDLMAVRGIGPARAETIVRHAVFIPSENKSGLPVRRQAAACGSGRTSGRGSDCRPGVEGGSGDG